MNSYAPCLVLLLVCLQVLPAGGLLVADSPVPTNATVSRASAHNIVFARSLWTQLAPHTRATAGTFAADNGVIARQHLVALSDNIGARVCGTADEAEAAQYIEDTFDDLGYDVQLQPFSFTAEGDVAETALDSTNVIAVKAGLSTSEIVVGAHYDSVDVGQGADDNASGAAVMLEVAEKIVDTQTPYTIRFIAFSAEEADLDGSRYYVEQMSDSDIQNTVGMINLDSLIAGDIIYVYGDAASPGSMLNWISRRALDEGFDLEPLPEEDLDSPDGTPCNCADYGPFQVAGIPFAYFEATNWELGDEDGSTQVDPQYGEQGVIRHTQYDTIDYLDTTFQGRVDEHLNVIVTLVYDTLTEYGATSSLYLPVIARLS
jgi:alkaline phosphatase isozyme conversion protein